MHVSFLRALQWTGIAVVLAALVGLNWDFESEARMQMNSAIEDPLSQSLLGYWKMDEGTGTSTTADASGNATTLTMTAMDAEDWQTGQIGPFMLDFDGSAEWLTATDPAVLDFADGASFSITGWFNRDTEDTVDTIVAKRNGTANTDDGYMVYIGTDDLLYFEASEISGTDERQVVSTSTFATTGWHHFAVSWEDDREVSLFIDGAPQGTSSGSTFANVASLVTALDFHIGSESDNGNPFNGKLDDIRVYGYPLSSDQVLKLYQTTAPAQPVDTGLVGHWTFDGPDIQGLTAIDRSGKGNHGTITGTTKTIGKLGQGLSFNGTSDAVVFSFIPPSILFYTNWEYGTHASDQYTHATPEIPNNFLWDVAHGSIVVDNNPPWNGQSLFDMSVSWVNGMETNDLTSSHMQATSGRVLVEIDQATVNGKSFFILQATTAANGRVRIDRTISGNLEAELVFNDGNSSNILDFGTFPSSPCVVEMIYNSNASTAAERLRGRVWNVGETPGSFTNAQTNSGSATTTSQFTNSYIGGYDNENYGLILGRIIISNSMTEDLSLVRDGSAIDDTIKTIALWMQADDTTSRKILNMDGTDQIELNGSSQVTATSFPGTTAVYVDGVVGSTVSSGWHHVVVTDTTGVSVSRLEIGRVSSSYFDGRIDDVRIYNRVLTAGEVANLYTVGR